MYSWKDYHLTLELDFYENSKEGEKNGPSNSQADANAFAIISHVKIEL